MPLKLILLHENNSLQVGFNCWSFGMTQFIGCWWHHVDVST